MDKSKLGEWIQSIRKKNKMTQEQLAEKADIALRVLQRVENGKGNPKVATLDSIAQALGTPFEVVFGVDPSKGTSGTYLIPSMAFHANLLATIDSLPPIKKQFVFALIFDDEGYIEAPALRRLLKESLKAL